MVYEIWVVENKRLFREPNKFTVYHRQWNRVYYAKNEQEAIGRVEMSDDESWSSFSSFREHKILEKTIIAEETTNLTFDSLKELMPANDFIRYCKDNFMPIEVIIGGTK